MVTYRQPRDRTGACLHRIRSGESPSMEPKYGTQEQRLAAHTVIFASLRASPPVIYTYARFSTETAAYVISDFTFSMWSARP
jgi:hypothetical protein